MIRRNQFLLNLVNAFTDGVIVLVSYLLAAWLWLDVFKAEPNIASIRRLSEGIGAAAVVYSLVMVALLALFRLYNPARSRRIRYDMLAITAANTVGTLSVATILFIFRLQEFSRGVLLLFYLLSLGFLNLKHVILRLTLDTIRTNGYNLKHILVVGTGYLAIQFTEDLKASPNVGFHIVGYIGRHKQISNEEFLGSFEALAPKLEDNTIDEVVIALEADEMTYFQEAISACEKSGTKVSVIPYYNNIIPSYPTIELIGRSKLINLRSNPLDNVGYAAIKRIFDILSSLLILTVLSPVLLCLAAGVKLSSPGPILFKQPRVGRGKKNFTMLKFRSMRVNAAENTAWSTNRDPRKTAFGSFIRKFSLDELPQLFNVLKGDMSLIGPRPEIPFYVERFKENIPLYMVKHQVRPGMTGWAQVNGYRGNTSIEKRIEYDVWYIENWSIGLDIKILFKTVFGAWMNHEELAIQKAEKESIKD